MVILYLGHGGFNNKKYIDKGKFYKSDNLQRNFLSSFAQQNNILYFDLDKDIDATFKSSDHIKGHFSDEGYKKVSRIILSYIKDISKSSN